MNYGLKVEEFNIDDTNNVISYRSLRLTFMFYVLYLHN